MVRGQVPAVANTIPSSSGSQDTGSIGVLTFSDPFRLDRRPSEYFQTNCWIGASFMTRDAAEDRYLVGVDRIMWGSDFPHDEGTYPHSTEALAHAFGNVDPAEVERIVGATAAEVYGFDLDALAPLARRIGPDIDAVAAGLDAIPPSTSMAFEPRAAGPHEPAGSADASVRWVWCRGGRGWL